jgi:aromatic ring-opening dioxygenase catalytic subunit (LigB family)
MTPHEIPSRPVTRRQATLALAGVAAGALGCTSKQGCTPKQSAAPTKEDEGSAAAAGSRMPVAFIPHGGGPWPIMALSGMADAERVALADYMRSISRIPATKPAALVVISAHWESDAIAINTGAKPELYYDYSGFPPEAYKLSWPAPGAPDLAGEIEDLVKAAGLPTRRDATRGYDHGTFVPLLMAYPDADVPVVQISLKRGLDPAEHIALGAALAPLRERGAFIVGSGNSFHNMRAFMGRDGSMAGASQKFDSWLAQTVAALPEPRHRELMAWIQAPDARRCHPREEHLLPLMVVAGAAGDDLGRVAWTGKMAGISISAHHFG